MTDKKKENSDLSSPFRGTGGKPSLPQGTRDFGPDVVRKRQYIFNTIKNVFELYGFEPLETPAMENLDTLMGKYGEEGDKLIYRILESGNPFTETFTNKYLEPYNKHDLNIELNNFFIDLLKKVQNFSKQYNEQAKAYLKQLNINIDGPYDLPFYAVNPEIVRSISEEFLNDDEFKKKYLPELKGEISKKALRYDLTIPFARYVAMNHGKLNFPFKRYQIQPVWRADRPQKGRYREFYQCDADIVGSNSLINEVEFVNIYHHVFTQLGIKNYELRINSRKILTALAEISGGIDKMMDITIAIDKLDKIGLEKVKEELAQRGLSIEQIDVVENYLNIDGNNEEKLQNIKQLFSNSEIGKKGIAELEYILSTTNYKLQTINLSIDFTLARGLNYYTGVIFEAKAPAEIKIGSIGGGGRYDDLTGLFGVPNIPGVGISFGVDRIYDVMEELNLFPETVEQGTKVLFFNLGEEESKTAYQLLQQLRGKGVASEIFHESSKMEKQFKYAEKKNIPFVVIIGSKEIENKTATVKNLKTSEQKSISFDDLEQEINRLIKS